MANISLFTLQANSKFFFKNGKKNVTKAVKKYCMCHIYTYVDTNIGTIFTKIIFNILN